jgi:hypothetical protein
VQIRGNRAGVAKAPGYHVDVHEPERAARLRSFSIPPEWALLGASRFGGASAAPALPIGRGRERLFATDADKRQVPRPAEFAKMASRCRP